MKHYRVEDAEHRGIGADAERERQNCGYAENRLPNKRTKSIAKFAHL